MKDAILISLREHLKALKLSSMVSGIETHLRQAKESGIGYDEFLLDLATTELQVRAENRLTRRISATAVTIYLSWMSLATSPSPRRDRSCFSRS